MYIIDYYGDKQPYLSKMMSVYVLFDFYRSSGNSRRVACVLWVQALCHLSFPTYLDNVTRRKICCSSAQSDFHILMREKRTSRL